MRRAALLVPALLLAAPPSRAQFTGKSFGDGGGYKHPDREASRYLETAPNAPADRVRVPEESPRTPPSSPSRAPSDSTGRIRIVRKPAAATTGAPSLAESPRPGESARNAPVLESAGEGADERSEAARRDYDEKILGEAPSRPRPELTGGPSPSRSDEGSSALASESAGADGRLFVSFELDPGEAGTLRDAVAGLGASAAFLPDARFQPAALGGGLYRVSGWIPSSRLNDALSRPGVRRAAVAPPARPMPATAVGDDYLIGVKVADAAAAEESARRATEELSRRSGFALRRFVGVTPLPDGGAMVVLEGRLPALGVSRAMQTPGVATLTPAPVARLQSAAPARAPARRGGFVGFMLTRGLWLILLTLLLALPAVAPRLAGFLRVFDPYQR